MFKYYRYTIRRKHKKIRGIKEIYYQARVKYGNYKFQCYGTCAIWCEVINFKDFTKAFEWILRSREFKNLKDYYTIRRRISEKSRKYEWITKNVEMEFSDFCVNEYNDLREQDINDSKIN